MTAEQSITKFTQTDNFRSSTGRELDVVGAGVRCGEGEQSGSLFRQRGGIFLGQPFEWLDCEGGGIAASDDLPGRISEAIDERNAWHGAVHSKALFVVFLGDESGSVGVGEQQVVEIIQEARWRRGVGVGPWRVRKVEQLASILVSESGEPWPEPVSNLAKPGQSRPRLYVLHGGRAEGSQVPQDHLLQRGIGRQRSA